MTSHPCKSRQHESDSASAPFVLGTAGWDGPSEQNARPLLSRADHDAEEMACLFQKQPRLQDQHSAQSKQSDLRGRDVGDHRINAARKSAPEVAEREERV